MYEDLGAAGLNMYNHADTSLPPAAGSLLLNKQCAGHTKGVCCYYYGFRATFQPSACTSTLCSTTRHTSATYCLLTSFNRNNFGPGMFSDGQLAISLAHSQQATVWGYANRQHRPWIFGGMCHLEGVQVIHLQARRQTAVATQAYVVMLHTGAEHLKDPKLHNTATKLPSHVGLADIQDQCDEMGLQISCKIPSWVCTNNA